MTGGATAENGGGPPGGWKSLLNIIRETNDRTKTLETGISAVKTELTNFKTEISGRMDDLEKRHEELVGEVDSRFENIKDEVLGTVSEEVATKLREWKDSIKAEILEELRADQAAGVEQHVSPEMKNSVVASKFENLVRLSRLLENNLCMGHTKTMMPSIRAQVLLRQFFPEFEFAIARVKSGAKLVRFSIVPKTKASAADFRAKLQEVRGALLTYGWWVAQENPSDLRSMYTVTNDFLKVAKENKNELKQFYLALERGWIFFHDIPIVPVFLVPAESNYWPARKVDLNWSMSDASLEHAHGCRSAIKATVVLSSKHARVACQAGDITWMLVIHPVHIKSSHRI